MKQEEFNNILKNAKIRILKSKEPIKWYSQDDIDKKDKEIERLHSIIKEVREYIKNKWEMELKDSMEDFLDHDELIDKKRLLHILEILDKENKDERNL